MREPLFGTYPAEKTRLGTIHLFSPPYPTRKQPSPLPSLPPLPHFPTPPTSPSSSLLAPFSPPSLRRRFLLRSFPVTGGASGVVRSVPRSHRKNKNRSLGFFFLSKKKTENQETKKERNDGDDDEREREREKEWQREKDRGARKQRKQKTKKSRAKENVQYIFRKSTESTRGQRCVILQQRKRRICILSSNKLEKKREEKSNDGEGRGRGRQKGVVTTRKEEKKNSFLSLSFFRKLSLFLNSRCSVLVLC